MARPTRFRLFSPLLPHFRAIFEKRFDERTVRAIAEDKAIESRERALAFERLRRESRPPPKGEVLGVIVEVTLEGGLDVLAAFADGRVRYINHTGKLTIVEDAHSVLRAKALAVIEAAWPLVARLEPWTQERLAPLSRRADV